MNLVGILLAAQIAIWPGTPPDAKPVGTESAVTVKDHLVAGRTWTWVTNVSQPTITIDPPKGKNSGIAIVVFPGGGYEGLAIDLEGSEVCDWVTSHGMTCVLLKYRVPCSPQAKEALQDAQRTIGLLRHRAAAYRINPHKIGVAGFSAGGHLVANLSMHFEKRAYAPVDAADIESCRPDFGIGVYPGLAARRFDASFADLVTPRMPPLLLVQAEDDPVDSVNDTLIFYTALQKAHVPAEMHLYAHGGHAFGVRPTNFPITRWPALVEEWLRTIP